MASSAEYHRNYYHTRVDKDRKMRVKKERGKRIRDEIRRYKAERGCAKCGFDNPMALQFHHRDSLAKEFTIANASKEGWGIERILREAEKCDVLCANCHMILHGE